MSRQRSIERFAARASTKDDQLRKKVTKAMDGNPQATAVSTIDSFTNFAMKLGVGADNALSTSSYGFNPISRVRTLLEWIHRGSWIGGVAVDVVATDMTRAGITLTGNLKPEKIEEIQKRAISLNIWPKLSETIKWSRLYGGCIAVMLIEGQRPETPLRLETVGKDQFKGLLVLDRWMVEPSLSDLVTEFGPHLGLPKFYRVTADAPALPRMNIHHSRCVRLVGIDLPYWQKVQENLWGISVLERLYDRMIAFDSATTGAAQLVYKSYLRTLKVKSLKQILAAGGAPERGMIKYVEMMRRFQGIEGMTLIDGDDEYEQQTHGAFSGLSDALTQFSQQLSGALQIPLVRLFGQSPAGFSTGETDLRMYYDLIKQQQNEHLLGAVTVIYRCLAASLGITLPESFGIDFNNLWQLTDKEKAEVAETVQRAVGAAQEAGQISDKVAMQELRQSSRITGVFSNITDKDIKEAEDEVVPPAELMEQAMAAAGGGEEEDGGDDKPGKGKPAVKQGKPAAKGGGGKGGSIKTPQTGPGKEPREGKRLKEDRRTVDTVRETMSALHRVHDIDVVIESPKGSIRRGGTGDGQWEARLAADYGYIRRIMGADGDALDCFIGDSPDSRYVYVINQGHTSIDEANRISPGDFDEHKVMLGFTKASDAATAYCNSYSDGLGPQRMLSMQKCSMGDFKRWMSDADLYIRKEPCQIGQMFLPDPIP